MLINVYPIYPNGEGPYQAIAEGDSENIGVGRSRNAAVDDLLVLRGGHDGDITEIVHHAQPRRNEAARQIALLVLSRAAAKTSKGTDFSAWHACSAADIGEILTACRAVLRDK